jgi:hypothetical protein
MLSVRTIYLIQPQDRNRHSRDMKIIGFKSILKKYFQGMTLEIRFDDNEFIEMLLI